MSKTLLSFTSVLLLALAGCNSAPPAPVVDIAAEEAKLHELEGGWVKAWAAKDLDKIVANYTADATVMAPGFPAMSGTAAIKDGLKGMLADSKLQLSFSSAKVEVAKGGDVAYTRGTYQMTMSDSKTKKPVTDKGSYVTIYKKQADGSWKASEDINTSSGAH